jgi:hypothetical protein
VGLAAAIWSSSFLSTGTTVRTVTIPVQFANVPAGMDIGPQSVDRLEIQLRGRAWLMDSVSLTGIAASFSLRGAGPGRHELTVDAGNVNLPPGIEMEHVSPEKITVRLMPQVK